jgi:hypothetical protein
MPVVINLATGKEEYLLDSEAAAAIEKGTHALRGDQKLAVQDQFGDVRSVTEENYEGYHRDMDATGAEQGAVSEAVDRARMEDERGGVLGAIRTGAEGAASSASLGLYDAAGGAIFGDEFRTRRKEDKQVHSEAALGGEVLGYLAPTGLAKAPGLVGKVARSSPVGIAERLGARVSATGAGKGLVGSATAKGVGFGLEGGIVGAGETLGDYALATTELERERVVSNLGSTLFHSAAIGGTLGAGSDIAARGIRKAKKLADGLSEKMAARSKVGDDIAGLDKEGIRNARAAEQARIGEELYEGIAKHGEVFDAVDPILVAGVDSKIETVLIRSRNKIRKAMDTPKVFKEKPGNIKVALQEQEHALEKLIAQRDDILSTLAKQDATHIKALKKLEATEGGLLKGKLAKKYGEFSGKKITKTAASEGLDVGAAEMARFRNALETGSLESARRTSVSRLEEVLDATRTQLEGTEGLLKGTAPKLAELRIAEDLLASGGGPKSWMQKTGEHAVYGAIVGAAATVMPFSMAAIGAAALAGKISDAVMQGLGKAGAKTAKRSADAVARFVDVGGKVLERTPPLATKVLAGARYAEKTPALPATLPKATLVREYKAREAEIYSQVTMGPNGVTMRPQARKNLAERLAGVRMVSPELADSIETIANRKISFLAQKLPKRPSYLAHKPGPDDWHPGNDAIRVFARYMAAVEDPDGIEDRLADGTITPQDVEAYKAVYPERYAAFRNDIAAKLPELQATLPIAKRMALSIFTGLPVEPSMEPRIFARLQAQYSEEEGTEGGTQAPQATPNFGPMGSVTSQEKTRAQERAE